MRISIGSIASALRREVSFLVDGGGHLTFVLCRNHGGLERQLFLQFFILQRKRERKTPVCGEKERVAMVQGRVVSL